MTEQLLSVERGCDPMSLRLGGQPVGFIFDEPAARLRSLAAIYEQPLNRGKTFTFTGRELAAMLKGSAE